MMENPVEEMQKILKCLEPDRKGFEDDPFGYSALAWHRWKLAQSIAEFPVDLTKPPTTENLNSPILWLTHAHAIAEAAKHVVLNEPDVSILPRNVSGVCDSQYCAVGLMLVAYSLEVSLKAMLIMKKGTSEYLSEEKAHRHHRLVELSQFVPNLNEKDRAILQILTHFSTWAGRYPDPGSGREKHAVEIFDLSERHKITAKELFSLAARVMGHAKQLTDNL